MQRLLFKLDFGVLCLNRLTLKGIILQLAIGGTNDDVVHDALSNLINNADHVSIAVSYVQLSGWSLLKSMLETSKAKSVRILCTDQMGITDPAAVREALKAGAIVRNYKSDGRTFHPKVYLSSTADGNHRFMSGSSNLSAAALRRSVEVNTIHEDDGEVLSWFEEMFEHRSIAFTEDVLSDMETAFRSRIHGHLTAGRKNKNRGKKIETVVDTEALFDSLFGDVDHDIGLLNFDHVGNTVRNLHQAKKLLEDSSNWAGKNGSELNRLGLMTDGNINQLGILFRDAKSLADAAEVWVRWLYQASDDELSTVNPFGRLLWARHALRNFWSFSSEISDYFLDHAVNPSLEVKRELQIIELLSNSRSSGANLALDDVKTLALLLNAKSTDVDGKVKEYFENKGARSWKSEDRAFIIQAWKKVAAA